MEDHPRLLKDFTPAPGVIKDDYEDFVVEEQPLYPFDGTGTHTFFLLEKAGLTTPQAVNSIAIALGRRRHEIGYAGMKDARAVTRQWMSIEHEDPARLQALEIPRLRVLETTRHHNKLRLGHLKGNFFIIRVRQTDPDRLADLQNALTQLAGRGVPNYFGQQRFGYRGDTWRIGQALVRNQVEEAMDLLLGKPTPEDHGEIRHARKLYDLGNYAKAAHTWPGLFHIERRALRAIARAKGNKRKALKVIDRRTRDFYISAYQSYLFNRVVAARLEPGLDQLWDGDLAWLHANGAVFRVENAATEQPRADRFEISPTGPLFGYRMTEPAGRPAEIEAAVFAQESLSPDALNSGPIRVTGGRRPLRFRAEDARLSLGADERGPYLELRFLLPRGSYATALLRELFRAESPEAAEQDTEGTEAPSA